MFNGRLFSAASIAFIFLFQIQTACHASNNDRCPPSSCGNIQNISHPFRLATDQKHCGDRRYTLSCENNSTVLYLYSGKYYVQAINYNNFTIRLVDVGVVEDDCSSFPLFSLTRYNFSYGDPYMWYFYKRSQPYLPFSKLSETAALLSCPNPVNYTYYTDTSPCIVSRFRIHLYVVFGSISLESLEESCTIEKMFMFPPKDYNDDVGTNGYQNMSYNDLHSQLAYGFELSWYNFNCTRCSAGGCYFDEGTKQIICVQPPHEIWICKLNNRLQIYDGCRNVGYRDIIGILVELWIAIKASFTSILILLGYIQAGRTSCGAPFVIALLIYKWRRRHLSEYDEIEEFLEHQNNLMPVRYSYSDIKKMTSGFRDKLGQGGFGSVYKGKLRSGRFAAVKVLGKSKGNGQDFISEVATIGRIHHVNVVQLIGYCADGSKRALVYDFMPNGSLEKYIFSRRGSTSLSWEKLCDISLGVARGIEYLHQGCDMQILHFDIKPHNILLDENFTPKVSDFGLAKLYSTDNSIASLTAARGTIGYMAPELFYKNIGQVSYKADVYSFGMLLLDMAGKRKNLDAREDHSSQYFPHWVYNQVSNGTPAEIGGATEQENGIIQKMVIVGLWCIQLNPSNRPSMTKVVEMLEGDLKNLELPPTPVLYADETPINDGSESDQSSFVSTDYTESTSLIMSFNHESMI